MTSFYEAFSVLGGYHVLPIALDSFLLYIGAEDNLAPRKLQHEVNQHLTSVTLVSRGFLRPREFVDLESFC